METMSHKQFQLLLWENAFRNAIPASDIFELTPLCNLDCRMCYVHLLDPSIKNKIMSGRQWIELMDQAMELGMISATLTGGEAMTHPDFEEIFTHLLNKGISVSVKSNGILLNESRRAFFRELTPSTIDISIYGYNRESYEKITGHDMFETVDRNLRAAKAEGLPLRFMITPSALTNDCLEDIMCYARSFDVKTIVNVQLLEPYENTGRHKEDFDLTVDQMIDIRKKALEFFPPEQVSFEEEEPVSDKTKKETVRKNGELRCIAGRSHFAITWDGVMIPCLNFPRNLINANIKEIPLKDAWNHIHEEIVAYRIPDACMICGYKDRCNYCPTSHGRYSLTRTCNPTTCALQKRLADEFR